MNASATPSCPCADCKGAACSCGCNAATPSPADGILLNSNNQLQYATLALGSALAFLDTTVVIVALPRMEEDLGLAGEMVGDLRRAGTEPTGDCAEHPPLVVVDWQALVRSPPAWLRGDGVHATVAGYKRGTLLDVFDVGVPEEQPPSSAPS